MKPHLTIKLRDTVTALDLPSWIEAIRDKAAVPERFHSAIDPLFDYHRMPFWVTAEYPKRYQQWSPQELRAGLDRVYRIVLQRDRQIPPELIRQISLLPFVEFVRHMPVAMARIPAGDGAEEGDRMPVGSRAYSSRASIGLETAQAFTKGRSDVKVAVLDTGVDLTHPELRGVLLPGHDFVDIIDGSVEFVGDHVGADNIPEDEVGHGTHVSGIIASRGMRMPIGVAPGCRILPVRALAAMEKGGQRVGVGLIDNINNAVKWAVDQEVDVINMSLGVRHEGGGLPHQEVVDYAKDHGVTIVAASGNDGQRELYYPGALPHVIAVGAADDEGLVASFSTYGDQVSLIAPGVNILSSYRNHGYALSSGTSQAAPFVTGVVALMKSFSKSLGRRITDAQIKHVLKSTADKVDRQLKDPKAGFGMVNAADAIGWLSHQYNYAGVE